MSSCMDYSGYSNADFSEPRSLVDGGRMGSANYALPSKSLKTYLLCQSFPQRAVALEELK